MKTVAEKKDCFWRSAYISSVSLRNYHNLFHMMGVEEQKQCFDSWGKSVSDLQDSPVWIWRCSAVCGRCAGRLSECSMKLVTLCEQERPLTARCTLTAPSVLVAFPEYLCMVWMKLMAGWWLWNGGGWVDKQLAWLARWQCKLYFLLLLECTANYSQQGTGAQAALEIELQICFCAFR